MAGAREARALVDDQHLGPAPAPALSATFASAPAARVVYFPALEDRDGAADVAHLVACAGGEKNLRTIRKLDTGCGLSCVGALRTSRLPPRRLRYCSACLAAVGRGVLR